MMFGKLYCMKSVTLRKDVKDKLDVFADGLSVNKAVRKLLENADTYDKADAVVSQEYYNIKIDDDLLIKLKNCKLVNSESHSDTINRLLDEY